MQKARQKFSEGSLLTEEKFWLAFYRTAAASRRVSGSEGPYLYRIKPVNCGMSAFLQKESVIYYPKKPPYSSQNLFL